jgi:hypothetical protein
MFNVVHKYSDFAIFVAVFNTLSNREAFHDVDDSFTVIIYLPLKLEDNPLSDVRD